MISVDLINQRSSAYLTTIHFRAIQTLITVGLILSIVGGSSSTSSTGVYKVQTTSKVGIVLFIVAYVALALITVFSTFKLSCAETGEKRLVLAVILALPFILVRLAYSGLAALGHNRDFNLIDGSVVLVVVMSVLMEFAVVFIYLLVGAKTESTPVTQSHPISSRPWKGEHTSIPHAAGHQRQDPVRGLVGLAVAAAHHAQQDAELGREQPPANSTPSRC